MRDVYKEIIGKTHAEVRTAQQQLVNITLRVALDELYKHVAHVEPILYGDHHIETLTNEKREPCKTAKETLQALLTMYPGYTDKEQAKRVRAFNKLAAAHGFDLSLKSSGYKSPDSLLSKNDRPVNSQVPRDIARITVVTDNLAVTKDLQETLGRKLNKPSSTFADLLENQIDAANSNHNFVSHGDERTDWEINGRGFFRYVMNKQILGVGTEIMFLPRSQAVTAERVSHMYFEISRGWDNYNLRLEKDRQVTDKAQQPLNREARLKERTKIIEQYNKVATFINTLTMAPELADKGEMFLGEKALASSGKSRFTLDEYGEGGKDDPAVQKNPASGFSPIFTMSSIRTYQVYLRKMKDQLPYFSKEEQLAGRLIPSIGPDDSDNQVDEKLMNLFYLGQIAHACYMQDAPLEMRTEWVADAKKHNQISKKGGDIPAVLIESVAQGRKGEPHVDVKAVDQALRDDPVWRAKKKEAHARN